MDRRFESVKTKKNRAQKTETTEKSDKQGEFQMYKRHLSTILLAGIMTASILAGCGSQTAGTGQETAVNTLCNGRFNDKRYFPVPSCAVFSAHKRRPLFCEEPAYDFGILGICTDVRSSRVSLEHDTGNGEEAFPETVCGPGMGGTYSGVYDCGIWNIRFHKEGYRSLHAAEEPFCLFRL